MKAREWYERGNQVSDPVEAFSNFWRGFNNLFFCVGNGNEREKIKLFLKQRVTESQAAKLLQDYPHNITYLLSQPVIDMRGSGRNTAPNIQAFNIAVDSVTKLQELFMVIYQVIHFQINNFQALNGTAPVLRGFNRKRWKFNF